MFLYVKKYAVDNGTEAVSYTHLQFVSKKGGKIELSKQTDARERRPHMGFLDFFFQTDINAGLAPYQADPKGVLLDVRTREMCIRDRGNSA